VLCCRLVADSGNTSKAESQLRLYVYVAIEAAYSIQDERWETPDNSDWNSTEPEHESIQGRPRYVRLQGWDEVLRIVAQMISKLTWDVTYESRRALRPANFLGGNTPARALIRRAECTC
jgi:hypothetical protein